MKRQDKFAMASDVIGIIVVFTVLLIALIR